MPNSKTHSSLHVFVRPGNMTMRWRGMAMRRMSMFPNGNPTHIAFTEDAIRNEMENGKAGVGL